MTGSVQKLRVEASVSIPGRAPLLGAFALAPRAEFRAGPETLLERLNTRDRVVPFIRGEDETTCLLPRLDIEWVRAEEHVDAGLVCPPDGRTRERRIEVRFESGAVLGGRLRIEPGAPGAKDDLLQGPGDFFPLKCGDGILLLNRHRILETRLQDRAPRVPAPAKRRRRAPA